MANKIEIIQAMKEEEAKSYSFEATIVSASVIENKVWFMLSVEVPHFDKEGAFVLSRKMSINALQAWTKLAEVEYQIARLCDVLKSNEISAKYARFFVGKTVQLKRDLHQQGEPIDGTNADNGTYEHNVFGTSIELLYGDECKFSPVTEKAIFADIEKDIEKAFARKTAIAEVNPLDMLLN